MTKKGPSNSRYIISIKCLEIIDISIIELSNLFSDVRVKPKSIPDPEMSDLLKKDYHLFACLDYIHNGKESGREGTLGFLSH